MDREKVIQGAREFFFGSVTMVLIVTGSYSWRNGLNLGCIFSGALLLYVVYVTGGSKNEP